jgi:RNA polymerase sigma factor (sigma-70 family)
MDEALFLQRCIRREPYAWDEFLATYSRLIYSTIYSTLKIKCCDCDNSVVEDIFQESVVYLMKEDCRKLRSFQGRNGCTFASWLRVVIGNFTVSYVRALKIGKTEELPQDDSLASVSDSGTQGYVSGRTLTGLASLHECIRMLTVDDRYFLVLHLQQGLTIEQLRRFFHVTRGALDMRKSRLIVRLKECFRRKGGSDIPVLPKKGMPPGRK